MAELLSIMLNVITPIFVIIGVVVLIARRFHPDAAGLSTFIIYLFIPALAFTGVAQAELSGGEVIGLAAVAVVMSVIMAVIGMAVSRYERFDRKLESAFLISIILVNAANYGIPLNRFAFGVEGERQAIIYYVMSVMVGNVLGVYFASRGAATVKQAIGNVLKVPITYAALAGLIVNLGHVALPLPLERAINICSQAAVPGMLALLGLKLAETSLRHIRWRPVLMATGIRLVIAPLIAFPLSMVFGLTGVPFQVAVVQSSMPTAVLANALATQFSSDTEFTSATTLVSTLASIVTLTIIIALLSR